MGPGTGLEKQSQFRRSVKFEVRIVKCKTKPILRLRPPVGAGGDNIADWGSRQAPPCTQLNCAKQTQFPADQKEGQVLGGKGVMVNSTFDRPRQNKANLRAKPGGTRPQGWGTRGKCAKQTQFPAAGMPHHSSIPLFQGSSPMPVAQNEPNCPKRGTEAVSGGAGWVEGCCTNKPNSCYYADPEIGVPGRARPHPTRGAIAPNKPNSAPRRADWVPGRRKCAKRSQFGPASTLQPGGMAPNKANFGGSGQESDANCAKRTQFWPVGPSRWPWNPPPCAGRTRCILCGLSAVAIGRQQR